MILAFLGKLRWVRNTGWSSVPLTLPWVRSSGGRASQATPYAREAL